MTAEIQKNSAARAGEGGQAMSIATIRKNSREELRVSVEEFRGFHLINLRVWFEAEDGNRRPGKHGVALRVELLPKLRAAIEDAEAEARRQGLISETADA